MKKLLFLLAVGMLFALGCADDDTNTTDFPACNDSRDPANEIDWIRQMIADNQNLTEQAHIICYQLDGRLVFLVDLCVPCGDGFEVFDCEKSPVCSNDQNGNSTCDYFTNNAINEVLIWKNY